MKVLLIGGSGIISSSITQQLLDKKADITLFNRGKSPVRFNGEFKLLVGDRTDHQDFEKQVRKAGPWDCVIDMICSDPKDAESFIRACKGITEQVVFCSTTNVYPKPADDYPVKEDHWLGAAYKNGIDKAQCEKLHRQAEENGDYKVTIVRPGHTYAEGGLVLHSLGNSTTYLDRIRQGKNIIIHDNGTSLWSALHADDVARVFVATVGNKIAFGKTYNATGQEWMTWDKYNQNVAMAMNAKIPKIVHIPTEILAKLAPERARQCQRSLQYPGIYDMTMTNNELGCRQQISFVQGIKRVINWIESNDGFDSWKSDFEYDKIIERWQLLEKNIK
jgi:nucleoside-diphosphate-sugar epimerase